MCWFRCGGLAAAGAELVARAGDRELDEEAGAAERGAADRDASAVVGDDPVDDGEAEPGAAGLVLGGEVRREDPVADVGRYARPAVLDHQRDRAAGARHPGL